MAGVFLGSEAIARALTRGQLRWSYRQIHRDVYLSKYAPRSLRDNIYAAWLWSGRRGIIAGRPTEVRGYHARLTGTDKIMVA